MSLPDRLAVVLLAVLGGIDLAALVAPNSPGQIAALVLALAADVTITHRLISRDAWHVHDRLLDEQAGTEVFWR